MLEQRWVRYVKGKGREVFLVYDIELEKLTKITLFLTKLQN